MRSLTISERTRYNDHIRFIRKWCNQDRREAVRRLIEIRDKKLYRDDYGTFEQCAEVEFGFKRAQAYRLMDVEQSRQQLEKANLSEISDKTANDSVVLALADVPKKAQAKVAKEAAKSGAITAKSLGEAKAKVLATAKKEEKEVVRDVDGCPIPGPALPSWNRRDEMKDLAQLISTARVALRKLDQEDPMLVEVNLQSVICDLDNAYRDFKQAIPTRVCGICQGQTPKTCALCKGRGVISDFRWIAVPEEVKQMRAKRCE
jgi:hypothetical protein